MRQLGGRDPSTAMWWRDHADHHMAVRMDPERLFASTGHYEDENEADNGASLPYEAPPAGLLPDVRELEERYAPRGVPAAWDRNVPD